MVIPKTGRRNLTTRWPDDAKEIAQKIILTYGEPDESTPSMLIWYHNGPWKKTIVYRDTVRHNFPFPHVNGLEQYIDHDIPMEKACEVMAFNGSVVMHGTRGEISAFGQDEPANFLAVNLAHDIIEGRKTFKQARRFFTESMLKYKQGKPVPYMEQLQFPPQENTADLDEVAVPPEKLCEMDSGNSS